MALAEIPNEIDVNQSWLVEYWANAIGVSTDAIRHAVGKTGKIVSSVRKLLKDGYRLSVVDNEGVDRLIARVRPQTGGFSVSVPYHEAKDGMVFRLPYDYSKEMSEVPLDETNTYRVSSRVKLSFHMDGFVQFSTADSKKIISGYNHELAQIKGVGLKSMSPVVVRTGPACGLKVQGLPGFTRRNNEIAEQFVREDFWHHPKFSTPSDRAINFEFFLLTQQEIRRSCLQGENRILRTSLPFRGKFQFDFDLRVLEFPQLPFGLGVIVSAAPMEDDESGYSLGGPGCFDEAGKAFGICACYPFPEKLKELDLPSLDYEEPTSTQTETK